jgi:hypothetical protein
MFYLFMLIKKAPFPFLLPKINDISILLKLVQNGSYEPIHVVVLFWSRPITIERFHIPRNLPHQTASAPHDASRSFEQGQEHVPSPNIPSVTPGAQRSKLRAGNATALHLPRVPGQEHRPPHHPA